MDIKLIDYLKSFLSKNDIDGLIINSTNEFLVEYNLLELNSRYHLTEFTGSTGDVLFTQDKIYLFVDTRYHEQADNQVNHEYIEVVKMPLSQSFLNALTEIVPAYFKLGIISTKTSKKLYDNLTKKLQQKNSTIKLLNTDPVIEYKILAGEMYEEMLINFKEDLVSHLMFVRIEKKIDNTDGIIENEIDLDEACPCNSGKIRRNCCSREVKTITEEGFSNFLMKVS